MLRRIRPADRVALGLPETDAVPPSGSPAPGAAFGRDLKWQAGALIDPVDLVFEARAVATIGAFGLEANEAGDRQVGVRAD